MKVNESQWIRTFSKKKKKNFKIRNEKTYLSMTHFQLWWPINSCLLVILLNCVNWIVNMCGLYTTKLHKRKKMEMEMTMMQNGKRWWKTWHYEKQSGLKAFKPSFSYNGLHQNKVCLLAMDNNAWYIAELVIVQYSTEQSETTLKQNATWTQWLKSL